MKKTNRKWLLGLCSVLAVSCVSAGGAYSMADVSAKADNNAAVFEMEYGAWIRAVAGSPGLRFRAIVDETTANAVVEDTARSFGMLVVPTAYINELFEGKEDGYTPKYIPELEALCQSKGVTLAKTETNTAGGEIVPYQDGDNYYVNGVIDVHYANTNRDFSALAYIKTVGAENVVTYQYADWATNPNDVGAAAAIENNSRSVAEVASAALNDKSAMTSIQKQTCENYVADALTSAEKENQGADVTFAFTDAAAVTLAPKDELQLTLDSKADLRVKYTSSDENVATVDETGKVTLTENVGKTTITASIGETFVATKTITSKSANGTLAWSEDALSFVEGVDAYVGANPADLSVVEYDGEDVLQVKYNDGFFTGSTVKSTPGVQFLNDDMFDINTASKLTFKVRVSDEWNLADNHGGIYILAENANVSSSGNLWNGTTNSAARDRYINGTKTTVWNLFGNGTVSTKAWVTVTVDFAGQANPSLSGLRILYANFQGGDYSGILNNNANCRNSWIYVSDVTLSTPIESGTQTSGTHVWTNDSIGTFAQGYDGYVNNYPADLSVTTVDGINALQVKYKAGFFETSGTNKATPGVELLNSDKFALSANSVVTFKVRVSDEWSVSDNKAGIYIITSCGSVSSSGNLWSGTTSSGVRTRTIGKQSVDVWNIFANGTVGEKGWVTVTIDFTGVENPTLAGLRIMYATREGSDYYGVLNTQGANGDSNAWIYISDITVSVNA